MEDLDLGVFAQAGPVGTLLPTSPFAGYKPEGLPGLDGDGGWDFDSFMDDFSFEEDPLHGCPPELEAGPSQSCVAGSDSTGLCSSESSEAVRTRRSQSRRRPGPNHAKPGAKRGPRPRRFKKNHCQADGCTADLSTLSFYYSRNHICLDHLKAESYAVGGVLSRFCQRCGQGHSLTDFAGKLRSCTASLRKHNARRRSKQLMTQASEAEQAGADAPTAAPESAAPEQAAPEQAPVVKEEPVELPAVALEPMHVVKDEPAAVASPETLAPSVPAPPQPLSAVLPSTPSPFVGLGMPGAVQLLALQGGAPHVALALGSGGLSAGALGGAPHVALALGSGGLSAGALGGAPLVLVPVAQLQSMLGLQGGGGAPLMLALPQGLAVAAAAQQQSLALAQRSVSSADTSAHSSSGGRNPAP